MSETDSLFPIENFTTPRRPTPPPSPVQERKPVATRTIGCLKAGTGKEDLDGQRNEILAYGKKHNLKIEEFIEIEKTSHKNRIRRTDELISKVKPGDTIIVTDLSSVGRSIVEVINVANEFTKNYVKLIAIRQNMSIDNKNDAQSKGIVKLLSELAEVERNLASSRTRAALAARKAKGVKLGRPKGALGQSKLDKHLDKIVEDLKARVSKAAIARKVRCSRPTIIKYIKSRGLAG